MTTEPERDTENGEQRLNEALDVLMTFWRTKELRVADAEAMEAVLIKNGRLQGPIERWEGADD